MTEWIFLILAALTILAASFWTLANRSARRREERQTADRKREERKTSFLHGYRKAIRETRDLISVSRRLPIDRQPTTHDLLDFFDKRLSTLAADAASRESLVDECGIYTTYFDGERELQALFDFVTRRWNEVRFNREQEPQEPNL
jgi:hypothetical protein